MNRKFPGTYIISKEAIADLRRRPESLMLSVIAPSALLLIMQFASAKVQDLVTSVIAQLPWSFAYAVLAVQTHRHILTGDDQPILPVRKIDVAYYLLWSVAIAGLSIALIFPSLWGQTTLIVLTILGFIPLMYVTSRLSLVLPDRAIGNRTPMTEIWKWSRGCGWAVVRAVMLPPILISVLVAVVTTALPKEVGELIRSAVSIPVIIFGVALLSVVYRRMSLAESASRL